MTRSESSDRSWDSSGPVWTIVVAGGSGHRYGGDKQLAELGRKRVLDHSLTVASSVSDGVVLVVTEDRVRAEQGSADAVVAGGTTRSASVRRGLAAVPDDAAVIVVHDAARPLTPASAFTRAIDLVRAGAPAAITAIAVVDTLVAVQTPQAFRADVLRAAHTSELEATDDAGLVEALGFAVSVVDGDIRSRKLTTPDDLVILEAFLANLPEAP